MAVKERNKENIDYLIIIIENNIIKQNNIHAFEILYLEFYKNLMENKIKRIDYYIIITSVIKYFEENYSDIDIVFEILHEIYSALIGHCSSNLIPQFNGEPENQNELVKFVRSEKWKFM